MGVVSDSVKNSFRAGTARGFAVMIFGMLAIMALFIAGIGNSMFLAIYKVTVKKGCVDLPSSCLQTALF